MLPFPLPPITPYDFWQSFSRLKPKRNCLETEMKRTWPCLPFSLSSFIFQISYVSVFKRHFQVSPWLIFFLLLHSERGNENVNSEGGEQTEQIFSMGLLPLHNVRLRRCTRNSLATSCSVHLRTGLLKQAVLIFKANAKAFTTAWKYVSIRNLKVAIWLDFLYYLFKNNTYYRQIQVWKGADFQTICYN